MWARSGRSIIRPIQTVWQREGDNILRKGFGRRTSRQDGCSKSRKRRAVDNGLGGRKAYMIFWLAEEIGSAICWVEVLIQQTVTESIPMVMHGMNATLESLPVLTALEIQSAIKCTQLSVTAKYLIQISIEASDAVLLL
ncbi:hypothetical protein JOM56_000277 [Amanita muscaria]